MDHAASIDELASAGDTSLIVEAEPPTAAAGVLTTKIEGEHAESCPIDLNANSSETTNSKASWMERYKALVEFQRVNHHCLVPCQFKENPPLGKWVSKQRTQMKLRQEGKKSQLTDDRIELLEKINFQWKAVVCEWSKRYQELVQFKQQHGHCRVPHDCSEFPKLGRWVVNVRWQYKLFQEGAKSHLNDDRLKMLDDLDFEWKVRDDSPGTWNVKYQRLKAYHAKHGNTLVPNEHKEDPALGRWVTKQRGQYKLFTDGKPSQMTAERVRLLEEISFDWNPFDSDWNRCYNLLKDYVLKQGHARVPFDYPSNPFLGKWVSRQRWQYKLHTDGRGSQLTEERISLLEKLGFEWRASTSDWNKRYEELSDFIDAKGHSLVPFDYAANPPLGRWVSKQRTQYKLFALKKPSQLNKERIALLGKLNFEWQPNEAKWMAHYVELKEHMSNGETRLPRHSKNPALRRWIEKQRRDPTKLPLKRREMLEKLGYPWPSEEVQGTPVNKAHKQAVKASIKQKDSLGDSEEVVGDCSNTQPSEKKDLRDVKTMAQEVQTKNQAAEPGETSVASDNTMSVESSQPAITEFNTDMETDVRSQSETT